MHDSKGTDVALLKKILSDKHIQKEEEFLERLTPGQRKFYQSMGFSTWGNWELQAELFSVGAEILYPGDPEGFFKIMKDIALKSYNHVYRFFLNLPSMDFVVKTSAQLWRTYHKDGEAEIIKIGANYYHFLVRRYPDMPSKMPIAIKAHLTAVLEILGCKNIHIDIEDLNHNEWRWVGRWDSAK